jgi:DNA uptake protein ComE-like DNA-binding protein
MIRVTSSAVLLGATTLLVGLSGCAAEEPEAVEAPATVAAPEAPAAAPAVAVVPADAPLIDPNTATREELLAVPGIDETTADAIVAGRPYDDMLAVDRVLAARLGEQEREAVYGRVWRPLDLNTASGEEILLIPGVGERLEHEFEEYRPYQAMAQFRREIGKYVDDAEVARLERYVTIR